MCVCAAVRFSRALPLLTSLIVTISGCWWFELRVIRGVGIGYWKERVVMMMLMGSLTATLMDGVLMLAFV